MNSNQMRVILGVFSLKAFVISPKAFHVMGIVRFGQEYGLLATNDEGEYFRVNGSLKLPLNTNEVRRAIAFSYGSGGRFAACAGHYPANYPNTVALPLNAPSVSIRRHRQMEDGNMQSHYRMLAANA